MKLQKKWMLIVSLFIILFMYGCGNSNSESATGGAVVEQKAATSGDVTEIPISEITSQAKFYSFDYNGVKINYFIIKGSDGKIRTAFDACDICGGRKGYRQERNDMVCNNCGRHFNIDPIGTKNLGGGCWPSYLSHEIKEGKIIIQKQKLEGGKRFFI